MESQADAPTLAESLGALVDLRDEGKVELIGLSAVTVADLDEASALTEIAGVQNSYNLLDRTSEPLLEATRERGLAFTPFFPLGSAFGDGRQRIAEHPTVVGVADKHGATPAQVALAWLLQRSPNVLLIPGHLVAAAPGGEPGRGRPGARRRRRGGAGRRLRGPAPRARSGRAGRS